MPRNASVVTKVEPKVAKLTILEKASFQKLFLDEFDFMARAARQADRQADPLLIQDIVHQTWSRLMSSPTSRQTVLAMVDDARNDRKVDGLCPHKRLRAYLLGAMRNVVRQRRNRKSEQMETAFDPMFLPGVSAGNPEHSLLRAQEAEHRWYRFMHAAAEAARATSKTHQRALLAALLVQIDSGEPATRVAAVHKVQREYLSEAKSKLKEAMQVDLPTGLVDPHLVELTRRVLDLIVRLVEAGDVHLQTHQAITSFRT